MERTELISIAKTLGWTVVDLNDHDNGLYIKGPAMQVQNVFTKGPSFMKEDSGWDYIIGRIRGGVGPEDDDTEVITGHRGQLLSEMMAYRHPSLDIVPKKDCKGNVYAVNERKQGKGPFLYTMTVGIECGKTDEMGVISAYWKPFSVAMQDADAIAREKATVEIYDQFKKWLVESVDVS